MMSTDRPAGVLEEARAKFEDIATANNLLDTDATVSVIPLTPEQAIGRPGRRDFPIVEGKERVVEATFRGARAHAFTDSPREFAGTLHDVLALELSSNHARSVFVAVLNAALHSLGVIQSCLHCRDDDPENCARELNGQILDKWGKVAVGLVGLNPAIAEALVGSFGVGHVRITGLNQQNVQTMRFGVAVWDGRTKTEELIRESDVVLVTGTTLVNGTFDRIWSWIRSYEKDYLIYGVTGAGVCELMGWSRICPYGRNG